MIRVAREVGVNEGLFVCPEGAACFAALKSLRPMAKFGPENAWSFQHRSGIKYFEAYDRGLGG